MEEVKQALLTIKKECTKQDDCEGCSISKVLGYSCQEVAIPEEWEIKGEKHEQSNSRCNNHSGYKFVDSKQIMHVGDDAIQKQENVN